MDIKSLINPSDEPGMPGHAQSNTTTSSASQQSYPSGSIPEQGIVFHNYGIDQGGIIDLGTSVASPQSSSRPPSKVKQPIEPDPQRQGVSGKRKDRPLIDPSTVPDGKGDKRWEERRDRDGGPKDGLNTFWVKKR